METSGEQLIMNSQVHESTLYFGNYEYELRDEQVLIRRYTGSEEKIVIPSEIQEKEVAMLGSHSFSGLTHLKEIVIPETVTTLYRASFKGCTSLTNVELPDGITIINAQAFMGCLSLYSVGLPYGLKRIAKSAFEGCTNLKTFYYFSKRHMGNYLKTDRNLRENHLPPFIEHIGKFAFKDCTTLKEITLPYEIQIIHQGVFQGCVSLRKVHIHNRLTTIRQSAFLGCMSLTEIKLPLTLKNISDQVFEPSTVFMCEAISKAYKYAKRNGLSVTRLPKISEMPKLSSQMIPYAKEDVFIPFEQHQSFYTEEVVSQCMEKYEMRKPSFDAINREQVQAILPVNASRYAFKGGIYVKKHQSTPNQVVIRMVGDLMARARQQLLAYEQGGYQFEHSFYFVKEIFAQSDFAIANLETMVSPSAPLTHEMEYVSARPHLNAPESFLAAIRNACFDAVVNAQNHVYDAGVLGILETLDLQNKYELMHTGAFVSSADKRYLLADVNGIKLAVVSYFDESRQLMKKANFTKIGRDTLLSIHKLHQVEKDVASARAEGAEFVLAYCHWGRKYTHELTDRQIRFAHEVANAGVDFIFGSHSHCVQPYGEIVTKDGRMVPVIYSGGNFLTDSNVKSPITGDTLIGELVLQQDEIGRVKIKSMGYYPCRILRLFEEKKSVAVVPTQVTFTNPVLTQELKQAEKRIEQVMGKGLAKLSLKRNNLTIDLNSPPFQLGYQQYNSLEDQNNLIL